MINFIFFWRLERAKGIDLIIDFISNHSDFCRRKKFNFYIFWDWTYKRQVETLSKKFDFVQYFWRQPKKIIEKYLIKSDFTLMPSRFLETFWLSALESLAMWVPVIWFKKWWLENFIFDEFDMLRITEDFDGDNRRLEDKHFSSSDINSQTMKYTITDNFNENHRQWYNIWKKIINNKKKIVCDTILSSDNHLTKSSDKFLFTLWFLKNDLWDRWDDDLKKFYQKKCLDVASNYTVDKWIKNFLKIAW